MRPKYVLKHFLKFHFLQKFFTLDRNFCHLSHLSNVDFLANFQIFIGYPLAPQKFLGGKIGQMWATWPTLPKKQQKNNKCWKMMFFEIFENFRFLKIFDPQIKKFKNTPRVVEISARLKNHENSSNKCKRSFWNPRAYFLTHFGFSMNLRLKFQHNFLVKNGLPWPKFRPLGGFLGVGEVGQLHFWKPLCWVIIHPKTLGVTPKSEKVMWMCNNVSTNCNAKRFGFPCKNLSHWAKNFVLYEHAESWSTVIHYNA